jgi:4-amino-4-deoxy-L-arabinose transferase-like glycosyltransferase
MSWDSIPYSRGLRARRTVRGVPAALERVRARPELAGLIGIAAVLNLWGLSINGWANSYYSAAVRSMDSSWHNFLFISLDKSGLMTVDKPPLSLWVQALSARVFGFNSLALLVPQALMGIAATALIYDLVRRRFGRAAGFAAGLVLATTPIAVAMSRHNNPDELLVLCCVAALWCTMRALETGRTRWLVWTGVLVGLGFETKMGVALMVVPGIALAYLWVAPRGYLTAIRQLIAGGCALAIVGLAWPILVTLTPAADRPWISGTSDNSIWSLIFSYNGVGRIAGQSGGPGAGGPGGGGLVFGGPTGIFRLVQAGLGDQAGWLLGFALVAGMAVLVSTRLRRRDPRTGWLILVGGAFLVTAVVFSLASGIFHPYYVSFLAPFVAALVGAGVGEALSSSRSARIVAPLAIAAGAVSELVVLRTLGGALSWATPLVIAVAALSCITLAVRLAPRARWAVLTVAMAALLAAPATWAAETLGHAASSTFPAGGPASASEGGPGGGPGGFGRHGFGGRGGFPPPGAGGFGTPGAGGFALPGAAGAGAGGFAPPSAASRSSQNNIRGLFSQTGSTIHGAPRFGGGFGGFGGAGGPGGIFGGDSAGLKAAIAYAKAHGGGTIGVSSQSSAAAAILSSNANVAGLGGFSGRESSVTVSWLAMEVRSGHLRWVIDDAGQSFRAQGDTRQGSQAAMAVVAKVCKSVTVSSASGTKTTMYDCRGRAAAILAATTS